MQKFTEWLVKEDQSPTTGQYHVLMSMAQEAMTTYKRLWQKLEPIPANDTSVYALRQPINQLGHELGNIQEVLKQMMGIRK